MVSAAITGACSLKRSPQEMFIGQIVPSSMDGNGFDDRQRNLRSAASRDIANCSDARVHWLILVVRTGSEGRIAVEMEDANIHTMLLTKPTRQTFRPRGGDTVSVRTVNKVQLPGYLFVRCLVSDQAWHGLMSFEGVVDSLRMRQSGKPALFSDKEMFDFVLNVSGLATDLSTAEQLFEGGDTVRFTKGRMQGYQGIVCDQYKGDAQVPVEIVGVNVGAIRMASVDELEKLI